MHTSNHIPQVHYGGVHSFEKSTAVVSTNPTRSVYEARGRDMQSFFGPVLPSRGKAGESRLRPADTKRTKSRVRNSDRGIRSADSTARRAGKWKMLRRLSRQLYRNKTLLATVLIPPSGAQDSHPRSQEYKPKPQEREEESKTTRQNEFIYQ